MNFCKLSLRKVYFIKEKQNMNKNYIGTYGVIKKKWWDRSYLFSKL